MHPVINNEEFVSDSSDSDSDGESQMSSMESVCPSWDIMCASLNVPRPTQHDEVLVRALVCAPFDTLSIDISLLQQYDEVIMRGQSLRADLKNILALTEDLCNTYDVENVHGVDGKDGKDYARGNGSG